MYIHFLKRDVSNHDRSAEATRGCGRVPHVFSGLISVFVFDILQIPSGRIQIYGALHPLAPPWLRAWAGYKKQHKHSRSEHNANSVSSAWRNT
jgi:hypothetical protein